MIHFLFARILKELFTVCKCVSNLSNNYSKLKSNGYTVGCGFAVKSKIFKTTFRDHMTGFVLRSIYVFHLSLRHTHTHTHTYTLSLSLSLSLSLQNKAGKPSRNLS